MEKSNNSISIYPDYSAKGKNGHGEPTCESSADGAAGGKDRLVDRVKRFLKVDNDDTEELHNKYRETSKDREEKIKLFEEQLNIKIHSPTSSRKSPLLDSHMSISLMFLAIMVLLLLSIFLVFKLTSRVEDLEDMLATVHDYVEKVTANLTENPQSADRSNPGVIKGRAKG